MAWIAHHSFKMLQQLFATLLLAVVACHKVHAWRPLLTFATGTALTSDLGESANYPIQNPTSDEFYIYTAAHSNQTSGLGSIFVGAEWNIKPQQHLI